MSWKKGKFGTILLVFELTFLVLFGIFAKYTDEATARHEANSRDLQNTGNGSQDDSVAKLYPMFQDVHAMIFVGFGFLMTFMKRYGYGAVGLNFLVACFVIQWATLFGGLIHLDSEHGNHFFIDIKSLLTADFAAAAVLITFGALLGKISPLQLIAIAFFEIIFFTINEEIGLNYFKAVDMGGSMFVHCFGAYFGLAVAWIVGRDDQRDSNKEGSVYHSDLFSMIGTIFLWIYWPSFNSALATGDDQHRAVINTYFALGACCVSTFALSSLLSEDKFNMVHIQNATLAGGVAVGTCADMMIDPWGGVLVGIIASLVSCVGFRYITPKLTHKLCIHDTCGVNNLHGMPGLVAGIIGVVVAGLASEDYYHESLYEIFPARAPAFNTTELLAIQKFLPNVMAGEGRTGYQQAGMQAAALACTLGMAIVSGLITGLLLRFPFCDIPKGRALYDDANTWEMPEDYLLDFESRPENKEDLLNDETQLTV